MIFKLIILVLTMSLIIFSGIADAKSPYGIMDVYYNDRLLPGSEVAKHVLKIDEPFSVAVEMTMYQDCQVYVELSDLGTYLGQNNYIVIEGPSDLGKSYDKIFIPNETLTLKWTLKPTDEWAGGTMPINFHYTIVEKENPEPIASGTFTIAYPYISTEHYEGDSTLPTTTTPDSPSSTDSPNSIPAFTFLTTALAIALATRKQ